MPCQNASLGICGHRKPRSDWASRQSDKGLHCPQTESLDTIEYFNGQQMLGLDSAYQQDDVNRHILHFCSKALFLLDTAKVK